MNRVIDKPVQISEKRFRHTMKLFGDPAPDPQRGVLPFLQELIDTPALLMCGNGLAQKIFISHDGERWVMTAEAEVDAP